MHREPGTTRQFGVMKHLHLVSIKPYRRAERLPSSAVKKITESDAKQCRKAYFLYVEDLSILPQAKLESTQSKSHLGNCLVDDEPGLITVKASHVTTTDLFSRSREGKSRHAAIVDSARGVADVRSCGPTWEHRGGRHRTSRHTWRSQQADPAVGAVARTGALCTIGTANDAYRPWYRLRPGARERIWANRPSLQELRTTDGKANTPCARARDLCHALAHTATTPILRTPPQYRGPRHDDHDHMVTRTECLRYCHSEGRHFASPVSRPYSVPRRQFRH